MPTNPALWIPEHLGTQMGQGIPIFNRWHRLAASCIAAYVPGAFPAGDVINLVSPGLGDLTTRTGTDVNLVQTPDGLAVNGTGTSSANVLQGNTPTGGQWRLTTTQSIFYRGIKTATAASNTPTLLIGVQFNASPFNSFGMGFGGTASGGPGAITAYQTSVSSAQTGAIVPPLQQMFDAVMTFPPGIAVGAQLWVNGVKDTVADATTVNITYGGTVVTTQMSSANNSGRNAASNGNVAYIWAPRLLQAMDAVHLHQNPYCLLLWPEDIMMAQLVGRSTTTPNNGPQLPFLSPLTAGLGGLASAERWLARRKLMMRRLRGE